MIVFRLFQVKFFGAIRVIGNRLANFRPKIAKLQKSCLIDANPPTMV